jgi:hypothetical protein
MDGREFAFRAAGNIQLQGLFSPERERAVVDPPLKLNAGELCVLVIPKPGQLQGARVGELPPDDRRSVRARELYPDVTRVIGVR